MTKKKGEKKKRGIVVTPNLETEEQKELIKRALLPTLADAIAKRIRQKKQKGSESDEQQEGASEGTEAKESPET